MQGHHSMSKIKPVGRLWIELWPAKAVYFPGQTVEGVVICTNMRSPKNATLTATCLGVGATFFETKHTNTRPARVNSEIYLQELRLLLSGRAEKFKTFSGGPEEFPFRFTLHHGIPCSFDSKYGFVSYTVTARLTNNRLKEGANEETCWFRSPVGSYNGIKDDPLQSVSERGREGDWSNDWRRTIVQHKLKNSPFQAVSRGRSSYTKSRGSRD